MVLNMLSNTALSIEMFQKWPVPVVFGAFVGNLGGLGWSLISGRK